MTTHYYSTIFNTKINKWVWGTFDIFIERVATLVSLCGSPCFLVCRILTEVCEDEFHCVRHSWGLHSHWMLFSVPDIDRSLWRQIWMCQRQPRSPFSLLFSVPEIDTSLRRQTWMCQRQPRYWQRSMKTNLNVSETAEVLTEVYEDQSECVRNSRGTDRGLWRPIWTCQKQPRSPFLPLFSVLDIDRSLGKQIWMCQRHAKVSISVLACQQLSPMHTRLKQVVRYKRAADTAGKKCVHCFSLYEQHTFCGIQSISPLLDV